MRTPTRAKNRALLPGHTGTLRVGRRTATLLPRLRPGDIAVIDELDLDRGTAQRLVDAGVSAVLNAAPMLSGRYAALGPQVLVDAGVLLLDRLEGGDALRDGAAVRIHHGVVHTGETPVALGRELDRDTLALELDQARHGMTTQLETFTHNSTEFLRREQDLLLHGLGLPVPATRFRGRPVVVVVAGHDHRAELASLRSFIREQDPVLVGVDRGADALLAAGLQPHVVVLGDSVDDDERPSAKALRGAKDVVVRVDRGRRMHHDQLDRLGVRPLPLESSATTEDAALLLADAGEADVIVGVGMHATIEEFLDRQRPGLASTYLTRLKVGHRLVDARSVPVLYAGRVRPLHLFWVLLAGLVALAAAVAVTPVGQEWGSELPRLLDDLIHDLQGLFR